MTDGSELYAVLAEFRESERLLDAARSLREQGFGPLDAFTPFPIEGLAETLGFHDRRVPWIALAGGALGLAGGFLMQAWPNLSYPLWVGGRPVVTPMGFGMITFVLMILGAVAGAIGSMFVLNRLPRLNHPMFDADDFSFESQDRFFLAVFPGKDFDRNEVGKALAALHPKAIIDVPGKPKL